MAQQLTPQLKDIAQWYQDVVNQAKLADYSPVKGCMVIRPYGYAIWERIQSILNKLFKEKGVQNAYFPLFIPESFIKKEKEHVEGFSPELAVVTHGGGKKLEEPLIVRPTSETIINDMFSKWIKSYRDLPLLINQWANVVRWELRTKLFLRTTEFLWQEGHTAHRTKEEAENFAKEMLYVYKRFLEEYLAIPVIEGEKTESEKFAGAVSTYSVEIFMRDHKALQAGTSHFLGQNFSTSFNIRYQDENAKMQYVWQTSWGVSTRLIGALILTHGDDKGLRLPPKVAPIQVRIIPIFKKDFDQDVLLQKVEDIRQKLLSKDIRVDIDIDKKASPGLRFAKAEIEGIPLRIEIGPKDIQNKEITLTRRDTLEKIKISENELLDTIDNLLVEIQGNLFTQAKEFLMSNIQKVDTFEEFEDAINDGKMAIAHWCGSKECEAKIKEKTSATIRCISFDKSGLEEEGKCIYCGKPSKRRVHFAKSH